MTQITIGLIQPATKKLHLDHNLAKSRRLIKKAADGGADIVCTPECMLDGYSFDSDEFQEDPSNYCIEDDKDDEYILKFSDMAQKAEVYMIIGCSLMQKDKKTNEPVYRNAALLFDPDGEIAGKYYKVHSTYKNLEATFYKHGESIPVFPVTVRDETFKIGIMICYDRQLPETARILRLKGAEIIFNPAATGNFRRRWNTNLMRTRAYENRCFVVSVNHAAPRINGRSFAVDVKGNVIKRLPHWNSFRNVTVDTQSVRNEEHNLRTRRPSVYEI